MSNVEYMTVLYVIIIFKISYRHYLNTTNNLSYFNILAECMEIWFESSKLPNSAKTKLNLLSSNEGNSTSSTIVFI